MAVASSRGLAVQAGRRRAATRCRTSPRITGRATCRRERRPRRDQSRERGTGCHQQAHPTATYPPSVATTNDPRRRATSRGGSTSTSPPSRSAPKARSTPAESAGRTQRYAAIRAGTQELAGPRPSPTTRSTPRAAAAGAVAVDDLWHATVMARGTFVYARSPIEVSYGLASILSGIQNQRKSRAGAAFGGQVLSAHEQHHLRADDRAGLGRRPPQGRDRSRPPARSQRLVERRQRVLKRSDRPDRTNATIASPGWIRRTAAS